VTFTTGMMQMIDPLFMEPEADHGRSSLAAAGRGHSGSCGCFWLAPIVGALSAGATYHLIVGNHPVSPEQPLAAA
jgi:hypothetical protein